MFYITNNRKIIFKIIKTIKKLIKIFKYLKKKNMVINNQKLN